MRCTLRYAKMNYQPLFYDSAHIGDIAITGCDNFWTLGEFRKADDYVKISVILEATIEDDNEEAIEKIDSLSFSLGILKKPIHDLRLTTMTTVEFKF